MSAIVLTGVTERWQRDYLTCALASLFECCAFAEELNTCADAAAVQVLSVFVHDAVNAAVLGLFPNLKMIAARSTGYDHIDLATCRARGIVVSNVPRYGDNTVAEHTFALILSLSRNLRKAYLKTLADDYSTNDLMGFDLKGRTLGVIGTGRIGLRVIKIAKGFSMRVLACDVRHDDFAADVLGFDYVALEQLLAQADFISLHAPLLPQTHHLINAASLRQVKRGALLINTARGGLIDTHALIEALDEGILAGAGLDVVENEAFIDAKEDEVLYDRCDAGIRRQILEQYNLLRRPNVVFTPHIAFNSRDAVQRILDTTIENVRAFLAGAPRNTVG